MTTYNVAIRATFAHARSLYGFAVRDGRGSSIYHTDLRWPSYAQAQQAAADWCRNALQTDRLLGRRSHVANQDLVELLRQEAGR